MRRIGKLLPLLLAACRSPSPGLPAGQQADAAPSAGRQDAGDPAGRYLASHPSTIAPPDAAAEPDGRYVASHPSTIGAAGLAGLAGLACLAEHLGGRVEGDALAMGEARWAWDDGRTKSTAERIAEPDLEDMFALGYPTGTIRAVTSEEDDPGRIRHEPLFRAVYGADAAAVSRALVRVTFAGHAVSFHRRAAPALARVDARLAPFVAREPKYFAQLGGTFATRTIAGTDRTSAHAWGIAIDLDPSQSDYWRNAGAGKKPVWKNRIPQEIVDAFESEGFVWGGRWFHYDTMHFEYRPELLDARCRTAPPDR